MSPLIVLQRPPVLSWNTGFRVTLQYRLSHTDASLQYLQSQQVLVQIIFHFFGISQTGSKICSSSNVRGAVSNEPLLCKSIGLCGSQERTVSVDKYSRCSAVSRFTRRHRGQTTEAVL